ncbi:MAG: hypothetical protein R2909_02800 [Gemmatimonadales bacterium]
MTTALRLANGREDQQAWHGRVRRPRLLVGTARMPTWRGDTVETDVLVIGHTVDIGPRDALDAGRHLLSIERQLGDSLWGRWILAPGVVALFDSATGRRIPDPAGYFCAGRKAGESTAGLPSPDGS